jgi:FkbM family methyltransferase
MANPSKEPKRIEDVEKSKLEVVYCVPLEQRDQQVFHNTIKVQDRIQPAPVTDEPIAIVCFGPSLNDTWEEIRKFKYIMSGSGSHKFLVERGIIPTHHIEVDPRDHKIDLMGPPQKGTQYYIASTCHPKLFKHLEGYDVKLWHIHSGDSPAVLPTVFPRGEYIFTGGSNVGLRSLVIARFLGFVNQHIFGMDCSMSQDGKHSHASPHPKGSKGYFLTDYDGVEYKVTQPLVEYSRQFFHELKQMPDVNTVLYGNGMLQHMARNKMIAPRDRALYKKGIAYMNPVTISKEYAELNRKLHEDNPLYGVSGAKRANVVIKLAETMKTQNILDYGCGKGLLAKKLPFPIWEYDPAVPGKDSPPKPADIVICTDVLEHVEPKLLDNVLGDIARCTIKTAYLVVHTGPAAKVLEDGRNAHLIQKDQAWWEERLSKFFEVGKVIKSGSELHIVVGPRSDFVVDTAVKENVSKISVGNRTVSYTTPNDVTRWRVNSIFTKEPHTIEWLKTLTDQDVLYDVGANVGIYSIYAAALGAKVIAFEPESQNYAALNQNIYINGFVNEIRSFCIALSDDQKLTDLHLSQFTIGGSCHSMESKVDFKHEPMTPKYSQGCVTARLDNLIDSGLPVPTHIKIDVDGFEPKVVAGLGKWISKVKSLIIEINPALEDHRQMIVYLQENGFSYDAQQVEQAERKTGSFKGVAEYVFTRK